MRTPLIEWDDPGRHGRCAAIEGWVNDGHVDRNKDVLLRILKNLYSCTRYTEMSITMAHLLEVDIEKTLIFQGIYT